RDLHTHPKLFHRAARQAPTPRAASLLLGPRTSIPNAYSWVMPLAARMPEVRSDTALLRPMRAAEVCQARDERRRVVPLHRRPPARATHAHRNRGACARPASPASWPARLARDRRALRLDRDF